MPHLDLFRCHNLYDLDPGKLISSFPGDRSQLTNGRAGQGGGGGALGIEGEHGVLHGLLGFRVALPDVPVVKETARQKPMGIQGRVRSIC